MRKGYHLEVGVDNELSDPKRWTYFAKYVETNTGNIKAQISGLKITKYKKWIKEFTNE